VKRAALCLSVALVLLAGTAGAEESEKKESGLPNLPSSNDEGTHFSMSLGAEYSEGDFGLGEESRFAGSTLRFKFSHGPWIARLAVPYLYSSGSGDVVGGPEAPIQVCDDEDNSGPGNAEDRCRAEQGGSTGSPTEARRIHSHGIGDVTLALSYTLDPPREYLPYLEFGVKAKFATADADDGLGTGRNDYTLQVDLDRPFGRVTPFAMAGYRFVGDPAGASLDDIWLASLGVSLDLDGGWSVGAAYDYRQHSASGAADSHEIGPFASWRISDRWRVGGYAAFGLSDGAPDWSAGTNLTYSFR